MSHYTEGQTHQLMTALERAGFTSAEISKLGQYPALEKFLLVLKSHAKIEPLPEDSMEVVDRTPYTEKQTHELMKALEAANYMREDISLLGKYYALGDFRLVINGKAGIVPIVKVSAEDILLAEQGPLGFDVYVNRSERPIYPLRTRQIMHPELERAGPSRYNLSSVEQWLHYRQNGLVKGQVIYNFLVSTNALNAHLNLQDGLAIQKKGIAVFRKFFNGKAVFLWKSVVKRYRGLGVPFLVEKGGEVVILWRWLDHEWNSIRPALRFAKLIL
jgi:hypothetical protein